MFLSLHFFFFWFQKGGGTIDLEPCLTHTSTVEPTLAPVAVERTMTTRAAASVLLTCSLQLTIWTYLPLPILWFLLFFLMLVWQKLSFLHVGPSITYPAYINLAFFKKKNFAVSCAFSFLRHVYSWACGLSNLQAFGRLTCKVCV